MSTNPTQSLHDAAVQDMVEGAVDLLRLCADERQPWAVELLRSLVQDAEDAPPILLKASNGTSKPKRSSSDVASSNRKYMQRVREEKRVAQERHAVEPAQDKSDREALCRMLLTLGPRTTAALATATGWGSNRVETLLQGHRWCEWEPDGWHLTHEGRLAVKGDG